MQISRRSVESLEFTIYCIRRCSCEACGAEAEVPSFDSEPWDGDINAWAHAIAIHLRLLGWTARAWDRMRCMRCSAKLSERKRASAHN